MSNPNQTPTYETTHPRTELVQATGELAVASTTSQGSVQEWTALHEPSTLAHWPGFDSNGEPKVGRQGRLYEKQRAQQLRSQPVDVAGEENRFFDVA